ncbi:ribonuclease 3-like [Aristolochia californica]|uniref:ribonuclease 3-like n=1 Tax=Aristolochia californica TaxID=171875 RepID=UPI0035DE3905
MASARFASVSFLLALLCIQAAAQTNVDFYALGLLWPGATCKKSGGCCKTQFAPDPLVDFFVTGLYTYNANGPVSRCQGAAFSEQLLQPILPDLWSYWQVLKCPSNPDNVLNFWSAVWTNYGTCTGLDEVTYFTTSLTQRKKFNVLNQLSQYQIAPNDLYYRTQTVVDALRWAFGVKTLLFCSNDANGKVQLQEIYICLNKNTFAAIDCPASWTQQCPDRFIFHSFSLNMLGSGSLLDSPLSHESA